MRFPVSYAVAIVVIFCGLLYVAPCGAQQTQQPSLVAVPGRTHGWWRPGIVYPRWNRWYIAKPVAVHPVALQPVVPALVVPTVPVIPVLPSAVAAPQSIQ